MQTKITTLLTLDGRAEGVVDFYTSLVVDCEDREVDEVRMSKIEIDGLRRGSEGAAVS